MNAISKKLLSVLLVLTMVLSMVSVGGLSIFAVETEAATYTNPGQDAIDAAETVQTKTAALATAIAESETDDVVAECPVCGTSKTWYSLDSDKITVGTQNGTAAYRPLQNYGANLHYYVNGKGETDVAFTGGNQNWLAHDKAYTQCLYLNGMNLSLNGARIFMNGDSSVLNIIGEGSIDFGSRPSGKTWTNSYGFQITKGTVNLYGGTYHSSDSTKTAAVGTLSSTGELNIYEGVTFTSTTSCVSMTSGTVNMYGGTIKDGTAALGGNVNMAGGTFNMYGGTIKDGESTDTSSTTVGGGNVYMTKGALNMYGDAEISGGTAAVVGGNVNLRQGTSSMTMYGNSKISGGVADKGGNIYGYYTSILMTEGASSEGGTATTEGPNIQLYCSNLVMQDNATVVGGQRGDGATDIVGAGINATVNSAQTQTSTVTLCDNATVKAATGKTQTKLIRMPNDCCTLQIDNGWTGSATFCDDNASEAGTTITRATCGEYADGTFTQGGTFAGELLYYNTNTGIVAADGVLTIGAVYVQTSTGNLWYVDNAAALTAYYANDGYTNGYIFTAAGDSTLALNGDIYIESRGHAMTLSGTGTVYALDKANDDYDGNGSWTVTSETVTMAGEAVNPINSRRYVVIETGEDTNVYGAHRIEVKLTAVTLRTTAAGLYYKASYTCDETLAGRITTYGVALNVTAVPTADFENEANTGFSTLTGFKDAYDAETNSVSGTSCGLFGVFKNEEGRDNVGYAAKEIFANAYIEVDMNGSEDYKVFVGSNGTGYTFAKALEAVNTMVGENKLTEAQLESLEQFYTDWSSLGDTFWADYSNIAALGNA